MNMHLSILLLFLMNLSLFSAVTTLEDNMDAKIVKYENTNDGSGNYHFSYETSNGITRDETGTFVNGGKPDAHVEVRGSVSYLEPNGDLVSVEYVADDKGYRILPTNDLKPVFAQAVSPSVLASLLGGGG